MSSFKAYLKKEWLEGLRTSKFLILALGIGFFSVSDPIMMKLLPTILKSQFEGFDISALADISQKGVMMSHMKSLYQVSTFIIAMTLMGIVATEKSDKTLTIPMSMGCSPVSIIVAKWSVYSSFLTLSVTLGVLFAYGYAGLIFTNDFASIGSVIKAGLLYGLFFSFLVSLLVFLSTLFKRPFMSGIMTLLVAYGMSGLGALVPKIQRYLPTQLLTEAKSFNLLPSTELEVSMIWSVGLIVLLLWSAAMKLKADELI